jgi:anti-sigma regulatory factor (Ser/Thr protein kinase)
LLAKSLDTTLSVRIMTWLTAQLVEELQYLLPDLDRIAGVVGGLEEATLAGIMEYGCFRWVNSPNLPALPPAITESELGVALNEVRTDLGLRMSGPPKPPLRRADVQPAEFHLVESKADLLSPDWEQFVLRYDRSSQSAGFSKAIASRLQAALCEMADNAVLHSDSPVAALVGYRVTEGVSQFCVADVGIGVLRSLTGCPDYRYLSVHNDAINAALKDGTTRHGIGQGGFGFRRVFKAITSQWGLLRFRSGEGCLSMDGYDLDCDQGTESFPPFLPGFQVSVCCRSNGRSHSTPLL